MSSQLSIHLRDTVTGDAAVYEMQWDGNDDGIDYMFRHGNYGCDCNRSNFLADALAGEYDTDLDCNSGPNRIAIDTITNEHGTILYAD